MKLSSILSVTGLCIAAATAGFVRVEDDGNFYEDGNDKRYIVWGANYWEAMNLGASKTGDRKRLIADLDKMKEMGINNLRIICASEGPEYPQKPRIVLQPEPGVYNEDLFEGLDYALYQMKKRNMKAVMVLNNFWQWSGGFSQYVSWANNNSSIPLPPGYPENDPLAQNTWGEFIDYAASFYSCEKCNIWWKNHIKKVINRRNKFTGKFYRNDDTIFSWELGNEVRQNDDGSKPVSDEWISSTTKFIKSLDKNHMITMGSEAHPNFGREIFIRENSHKELDYLTSHIWVQNWGYYDPKNSTEANLQKAIDFCVNHLVETATWALHLGKPIIFEEYGMARDGFNGLNEYDPNSPTTNRDKYFKAILEEVYRLTDKQIYQGQNFWAYSGQGRPETSIGEDHRDLYLGDPAHEHPGWYGVYDKDTSTQKLLISLKRKFQKIE